jgi:hypothetical protein
MLIAPGTPLGRAGPPSCRTFRRGFEPRRETCAVRPFQLFARAGKRKEQRPNGILTSLCQDARAVQHRSHFLSTGAFPLTPVPRGSRLRSDPRTSALRSPPHPDPGGGLLRRRIEPWIPEPERQRKETRHESTGQSRLAPPPRGAAAVGPSRLKTGESLRSSNSTTSQRPLVGSSDRRAPAAETHPNENRNNFRHRVQNPQRPDAPRKERGAFLCVWAAPLAGLTGRARSDRTKKEH